MNKITKYIKYKNINNINQKIRVGDIAEINIQIIENNKKRIQKFIGIIISIKKKGINSSFTIRKKTSYEGIERVFPRYSPIIKKINILKHINFKKSKLFYLRNKKINFANIKK